MIGLHHHHHIFLEMSKIVGQDSVSGMVLHNVVKNQKFKGYLMNFSIEHSIYRAINNYLDKGRL
jgi:hypothetical protein